MTTNLPERKPNRLPEYDYSTPGWYAITLCVQKRRCLLSTIENDQVHLKKPGEICLSVWNSLSQRYADVELDAFVVMPNHIHGIVRIVYSEQRNHNLGNIIKAYKSLVTKQYREWYLTTYQEYSLKLWQRSFYDHVIRNESGLDAVREYILMNPRNWGKDKLHP